MNKRLLPITMFSIACLTGQIERRLSDARPESQFVSRVEVLAFETRGTFIGAPIVRVFESLEHNDLSKAFKRGVADDIPFGIYKLEAYMTCCYSEVRYVAVYRPHVTIFVGLPFGREPPILPPRVQGRVIGSLPRDKTTFVKLIGIYSSRALESKIGPDGGFDLGVPWDGKYLLLVVSEDGILASRTIDVPYDVPNTTPTLEIKIGEH